MARDLDAALETEILAQKLRPFLAVKFEFDSGDVLLWSGIGDSPDIFGETYVGTGDLLQLSLAGETDDLRAEGARFTLSGINTAIISLALAENYQGRSATLYIGALDSAGQPVSEPAVLFVGKMDVMQIVSNGDTTTVSVSVESELRALEKASERRYTPEDQKIDFPNDLGLDFIPRLQDVDVVWG